MELEDRITYGRGKNHIVECPWCGRPNDFNQSEWNKDKKCKRCGQIFSLDPEKARKENQNLVKWTEEDKRTIGIGWLLIPVAIGIVAGFWSYYAATFILGWTGVLTIAWALIRNNNLKKNGEKWKQYYKVSVAGWVVVGLLVFASCAIYPNLQNTKRETKTTNESTTNKNTKPATSAEGGTYTASFGDIDVSLIFPVANDTTTEAIHSVYSRLCTLVPSNTPVGVIGQATVVNRSSATIDRDRFDFSVLYGSTVINGENAASFIDSFLGKAVDYYYNVMNAERSDGRFDEAEALNNQLKNEPTDIAPGASRSWYCLFNVLDVAEVKKVSVCYSPLTSPESEWQEEGMKKQ